MLLNSTTAPSSRHVIVNAGVIILGQPRNTGKSSFIMSSTSTLVKVLMKCQEILENEIIQNALSKVLMSCRNSIKAILVLFWPDAESNLNISLPLSYKYTGMLCMTELNCAKHLPPLSQRC